MVASCVTAITLHGLSRPDDSSEKNGRTTAADDRVLRRSPPAQPPPRDLGAGRQERPVGAAAAPRATRRTTGKGKGSTSGDKEDSDSSKTQQGGRPNRRPNPRSHLPTKKPPSASTTTRKSVRSVNYPDRYWHLGRDAGRLDPVSSGSSATTRQDSTFKLVTGLADASCYSFPPRTAPICATPDFRLRADRNDGTALFKKDATFCPRTSSYSGAVMLESVNYPGRYLRHKDFLLRLDPYENTGQYRAGLRVPPGEGLGLRLL